MVINKLLNIMLSLVCVCFSYLNLNTIVIKRITILIKKTYRDNKNSLCCIQKDLIVKLLK